MPKVNRSNVNTFAYGQWASITIKNPSSNATDLVIQNVKLEWGKFYDGSKDNEIPTSKIEGQIIPANGGSFKFSTCGRENASSGTEGWFDVVEKGSNAQVRHIYWECPWGSPHNTCYAEGGSSKWIVQQDGGSYESGALGDVTFTFVKLS